MNDECVIYQMSFLLLYLLDRLKTKTGPNNGPVSLLAPR